MRIFVLLSQMFIIFTSIFTIEKTIEVNDIHFDVSLIKSSQLIPLLVGILTVISILWVGIYRTSGDLLLQRYDATGNIRKRHPLLGRTIETVKGQHQ
jgi:hypothetical protein